MLFYIEKKLSNHILIFNSSSFLMSTYSDFAYVARDRLTRVHMCHVFRCETAARTIANTLR